MPYSLIVCLYIFGSYLLGSLPFGLWIAWRMKGIDIRTVGSGNIGSTNVTRICGAAAGRFVFALDLSKGLLPPLIGRYLFTGTGDTRWMILAGLMAIIGHNFSIFLRFQGGKGIATSLGVLLGVCPLAAVGVAVAFGVFFLAFRWISLGSIAAATSLPFFILLFYPRDYYLLAFGVFAACMADYRHKANIRRILNGTEPRVSLKRSSKPIASEEPADPSTDLPTHEAPQ